MDVVVTDGFTGNIALKTAEGTARYVSALVREALTSNLQAKLGAVIAMPALRKMREKIDPSAINGGPLLGLNGIVVKSHGSASAAGVANAVAVTARLLEENLTERISADLAELGTGAVNAHAGTSAEA